MERCSTPRRGLKAPGRLIHRMHGSPAGPCNFFILIFLSACILNRDEPCPSRYFFLPIRVFVYGVCESASGWAVDGFRTISSRLWIMAAPSYGGDCAGADDRIMVLTLRNAQGDQGLSLFLSFINS